MQVRGRERLPAFAALATLVFVLRKKTKRGEGGMADIGRDNDLEQGI
jgi:hypothetical protein